MTRPQRHLGWITWLVLATAGISGTRAFSGERFTIDRDHSSVIFSVRHLGLSFVYGRFNDFHGTFAWDADDLGACSVQVEIKTASVDTQVKKRDDHLRTADFFDVAQYPVMTFSSKKVTAAPDGSFDVAGNLTLHGVTQPVSFNVKFMGEGDDPWGGFRNGFHGHATIRRSDFGMTFMIPGVGDEIRIILSVEGIRVAEGETEIEK